MKEFLDEPSNRFSSIATINTVVWISSLRQVEQGITNRTLEDLEPYLKQQNINFEHHQIEHVDDLIRILIDLVGRANSGVRPIIHLDMHGDKDKGIHIVKTNEYIPWEKVNDILRLINSETGNNLCVVSMACFSINLIRPIQIKQPVPYFLLIAPPTEVTAGYIEKKVLSFYTHIFNTDDIVTAYKAHLCDKLILLHSEWLFFRSFATYVRSSTMGKGKQQRAEGLLSAVIRDSDNNTRASRRKYRSMIKSHIKPTPYLLNSWVKKFLHGRPVPFTIRDVCEHAKSLDDPYATSNRSRPNPLDYL